jgi:hypothetical protein
MHRVVLIIALLGCAAPTRSATLRGQVFDSAGHAVAKARVIAVHNVPIIEIYDRAYPPWNGLLGATYTDSRGYFRLEASDRASVDAVVAHIDHLVGGIGRGPVPSYIRITLRREVDVHEHLRRIRKKSKRANSDN